MTRTRGDGGFGEGEMAGVFLGFVEKASAVLGRPPPGDVPLDVIFGGDVDLSRRDLGAKMEGRRLIVPRGEEWLVWGLLAVFAFKLFLPGSIAGLAESWDLSWAFAWQQLDGAERRKWSDLWGEVAPKRVIGGIPYDPVRSFLFLEELSRGKGLAELVAVFDELDRYQLKLTDSEYVRHVEEFLSGYAVRLTAKEVRLIDAVLRWPGLGVRELAERIRTPPATISTTLSRLKKRRILYLRPMVFLSRLGLRTRYLQCVPLQGREREVEDLLRNSEFLFSLARFVDGKGGYIAILVGPDNISTKNKLESLKERVKGVTEAESCMLFRRVRRYRNVNFRTYSWQRGQWEINWQAWAAWMKRILLEQGYSDVISLEIPDMVGREEEGSKGISLDERDWTIIREVWSGEEWRVRQLRSKLRMGQNELVKRLKRLRGEGVIVDYAGVSHIGLSETAYLLVRGNPVELRPLIAALNELPYHVTAEVEGDVRGLFSILLLPSGHASHMAHQLRRHLPDLSAEIHLGVKIPVTYWEFPQTSPNPTSQS